MTDRQTTAIKPELRPEPAGNAKKKAGAPHSPGNLVRGHLWTLPPLLVLIVLRALLIHGDPTDFPMDRNIAASFYIEQAIKNIDPANLDLDASKRSISTKNEVPEFPFVLINAWVLSKVGVNPLVGARLFALGAALLAGLGLYILGRRIDPLVGLVALWLFALDPMAVFMGRALLPDSLMVAAIVWSLVAAGAGLDGRAGWRAAVGMALLMLIAALAKLSALFFVPVAVLALIQAVGWRRKAAWGAMAGVGTAAYLIVCAWYRLNPFWPLPGLQRISAKTNNVMASWDELFGAQPMGIAALRLVLALTLPGALLMLAGWLFLQRRPGQRLWLNAWLLTSLLFLGLTIKANTYWVYALIPAGCLLAGLALVEFYRFSRWTLALLGLIAIPALAICPGVAKVSSYFAVHPEYRPIRELADRMLTEGKSLYLGQVARDIAFFAQKPGRTIETAQSSLLKFYMHTGIYRYVLSNHLAGNDIIADLFTQQPILETRPQQYILYDAGAYPNARLGMALAAKDLKGPALNLDLAGMLGIQAASVSPAKAAPGSRLTLTVDFKKGAAYKAPPNLTLEFVHKATWEKFALPPLAGGAVFAQWSRPLLQTPNFAKGDLARMQYVFELSPHLPSGPYLLRFGLLEDRRRTAFLGQPQMVNLGLEILPPATPPTTSQELDPLQGLWSSPVIESLPAWFGQARQVAHLTSDNGLWLRPNLVPGDYELCVTGYGLPVRKVTSTTYGDKETTIWPILCVQKPKLTPPLQMRFDSSWTRSGRCTFHWNGPWDFLHLSIANPLTDYRLSEPLPLYLHELPGGNRSIVIKRIQIRPVRGAQ